MSREYCIVSLSVGLLLPPRAGECKKAARNVSHSLTHTGRGQVCSIHMNILYRDCKFSLYADQVDRRVERRVGREH